MFYPTPQAGRFLSNFILSILQTDDAAEAGKALEAATVAAVGLTSSDEDSLTKKKKKETQGMKGEDASGSLTPVLALTFLAAGDREELVLPLIAR